MIKAYPIGAPCKTTRERELTKTRRLPGGGVCVVCAHLRWSSSSSSASLTPVRPRPVRPHSRPNSKPAAREGYRPALPNPGPARRSHRTDRRGLATDHLFHSYAAVRHSIALVPAIGEVLGQLLVFFQPARLPEGTSRQYPRVTSPARRELTLDAPARRACRRCGIPVLRLPRSARAAACRSVLPYRPAVYR